jgi:hypothetical protein
MSTLMVFVAMQASRRHKAPRQAADLESNDGGAYRMVGMISPVLIETRPVGFPG